jgi:hypothetical protein
MIVCIYLREFKWPAHGVIITIYILTTNIFEPSPKKLGNKLLVLIMAFRNQEISIIKEHKRITMMMNIMVHFLRVYAKAMEFINIALEAIILVNGQILKRMVKEN